MHKLLPALVVIALGLGFAAPLFAHCQVPCGIYTDSMRFDVIEEHITTIEKAMSQAASLSQQGGEAMHQAVRWITTKESHAQEIQDIVAAYFLTQRIKPVSASDAGFEDYLKSLELLHHMTVFSMKCKQTTDPENVAKLREATAAFKEHYFKDKEHDHE
jgi:nickel superoxide dismutase